MIQLNIWFQHGVVHWVLTKLRPAHEWRALGSRYWTRSGEILLDEQHHDDRQAISAALTAILDRLGER